MLPYCKFNVSLLSLTNPVKDIMMKADDTNCILNIKYSILDPSTHGKIDKTEIEHFFVASDKKALLEKIHSFESSLKRKSAMSSLQRKKAYLKHFLESWKNTYQLMLKI